MTTSSDAEILIILYAEFMKSLKSINIELMRNMTDEQFDQYQKIMDELHAKDIKTNEIDLFNLAVKALSFSNHKFLH